MVKKFKKTIHLQLNNKAEFNSIIDILLSDDFFYNDLDILNENYCVSNFETAVDIIDINRCQKFMLSESDIKKLLNCKCVICRYESISEEEKNAYYGD